MDAHLTASVVDAIHDLSALVIGLGTGKEIDPPRVQRPTPQPEQQPATDAEIAAFFANAHGGE